MYLDVKGVFRRNDSLGDLFIVIGNTSIYEQRLDLLRRSVRNCRKNSSIISGFDQGNYFFFRSHLLELLKTDFLYISPQINKDLHE